MNQDKVKIISVTRDTINSKALYIHTTVNGEVVNGSGYSEGIAWTHRPDLGLTEAQKEILMHKVSIFINKNEI